MIREYPKTPENVFEPWGYFYYNPSLAFLPYTEIENKLTYALDKKEHFIKEEDRFWMMYEDYMYPFLGGLIFGGLAYLGISRIEKVQREKQIQNLEDLEKKQQKYKNAEQDQILSKKSQKYRARPESTKYDYINYLEVESRLNENFDITKKTIVRKSFQRIKTISLIFLISGILQGRIYARANYHKYALSYKDELDKIQLPMLEQPSDSV